MPVTRIPLRFWTDWLLPTAIFLPYTVLVFSFMFTRLLPQLNMGPKIIDQCDHELGTLPFRLKYTGISAVDSQLCGYVSFFHAAMGPSSIPYTIDFLVSFSTLTVFPYVEAARTGRSLILALPVLVGLLYQYLTFAAIYPLYCLAFIWSGAATLHKRPGGEHTKVDQAHAEGILFSLFMGFFIPSAAMIALDDSYVTAIWQFFPLLMTLSQLGHRLFRPSSRYPYSGYPTLRATYIILFVITSSYHISIVWPKLKDVASLQEFLLPDPFLHDVSFELGALGFLKWDNTFGTTSIILATFWFARNIKEFLALLAWYAVSIVLVGSGASLAAVFLWRESILNAMRPTATDSKVSEKK